jgi:heptosyltransferase-2
MNKEFDQRPILIVPYMWIGDFVRCHSVVRVLNERFPNRPVDMLASKLTAPLTQFMPGVRKAITFDIPRKKAAFSENFALAKLLGQEGYRSALIMPRKWKAAFAPWLAGIPERTGVFGEGRLFLLNDIRWDEKIHKRMIDQSCALALPKNAMLPNKWPLPQLSVSDAQAGEWRGRMNVAKGTRARLRLRPVRSAKRSAGRSPITQRPQSNSPKAVLKSGSSVARTRSRLQKKLSNMPGRACAISRAAS